jgi:hypothetical protein
VIALPPIVTIVAAAPLPRPSKSSIASPSRARTTRAA